MRGEGSRLDSALQLLSGCFCLSIKSHGVPYKSLGGKCAYVHTSA